MPLLPAFRGRRQCAAFGCRRSDTCTAPHRLQDPISNMGASQSGQSECRASWTCGPFGDRQVNAPSVARRKRWYRADSGGVPSGSL